MRFNRTRGFNMTGEATAKQIEIAESIHAVVGAELPAEKSKQAYCDYIGRWMSKYRAMLAEYVDLLQKGGG